MRQPRLCDVELASGTAGYSVHVKDHAMVHPQVAGRLTVVGVPVGEGFLPLRDLTEQLLEQGLRTFCFENVWAYRAPVQTGRVPLEGVKLGEGAFAFLNPPLDPKRLVLDLPQVTAAQLLDLEASALHRGVAAYRNILLELGCTGRWQSH